MSLKKYEIDAVVSTIVRKLQEANSKLKTTSPDKLKKLAQKQAEEEFNDITELEKAIDNLKSSISKRYNFSKGYNGYEFYNVTIPNVANIIFNQLVKDDAEQIGVINIDSELIAEKAILNSNKSLEEIVEILTKEFLSK